MTGFSSVLHLSSVNSEGQNPSGVAELVSKFLAFRGTHCGPFLDRVRSHSDAENVHNFLLRHCEMFLGLVSWVVRINYPFEHPHRRDFDGVRSGDRGGRRRRPSTILVLNRDCFLKRR